MNVHQKKRKKKKFFCSFSITFTEIFLYHEMSKQKLYNEKIQTNLIGKWLPDVECTFQKQFSNVSKLGIVLQDIDLTKYDFI